MAWFSIVLSLIAPPDNVSWRERILFLTEHEPASSQYEICGELIGPDNVRATLENWRLAGGTGVREVVLVRSHVDDLREFVDPESGQLNAITILLRGSSWRRSDSEFGCVVELFIMDGRGERTGAVVWIAPDVFFGNPEDVLTDTVGWVFDGMDSPQDTEAEFAVAPHSYVRVFLF